MTHLPSATTNPSISRPLSRQSMSGSRTPLGHYSSVSSRPESRRPHSSIGGSYAGMHAGYGHGHSASVNRLSNYDSQLLYEEDDTIGEALTPTHARRSAVGTAEAGPSSIPTPNSNVTRKRLSGLGTGRRTSSGPGEMGPPEKRGARRLSGVGETF